MSDFDGRIVTSVCINADLLMYGQMAIRIDQQEKGTSASWIAIADGGTVVSSGRKQFPEVDFRELINSLSELHYDVDEDDEMSICWSIAFGKENDEIVFSKEEGNWSRELLEEIIGLLSRSLDDEVTSDFEYLLSW